MQDHETIEAELIRMEADPGISAAIQTTLESMRREGAAMTLPSVLLHASRIVTSPGPAELIATLVMRQVRREAANTQA